MDFSNCISSVDLSFVDREDSDEWKNATNPYNSSTQRQVVGPLIFAVPYGQAPSARNNDLDDTEDEDLHGADLFGCSAAEQMQSVLSVSSTTTGHSAGPTTSPIVNG